MLSRKEVEHLSVLARIALEPDEIEQLTKDLEGILSYVSEISEVGTKDIHAEPGMLRNVLREDTDAKQGGVYSESILANAPHKEGNLFKVSQIL